jgi:NADPH:quinone reductase-like Zn-dependent oxidoreductase
MRIATFRAYGSPEVLTIEEVSKPTINDNEILVQVKVTAVTAADSRIRAARFPKGFGFLARLVFGITKPRVRVLGGVYSGVVADVGKAVVDFKVGDEVCGMTGAKMGAHAEYIKVGASKSIVKKPVRVSHEDAAGVLFGGTAALYFAHNKLQVAKGDTVVVNGASGAVGTNAVQLAKYYGASVVAVTDAKNSKLVTKLGADRVIDYTKQNLADSPERFDVIVDAVGNISPKQAKLLLKPHGRAGLMVASLGQMLRAHGPIKTGTATEKKEDIAFLLSLIEQGELQVVIDKVYDLEQIVTAHQYVDGGHKVGNVLVRL